MEIVLTIVQVIFSVALIAVVLFQSGKEAGLSSALAGGAETYMNKTGKSLDKTLASATKWIAAAWLVLTLVLSLI